MAEHDESRLFGIGFAVGATLGLAVGLLYAPKPGYETRADLRDKLVGAEETAERILSEARDKAATIVNEAKAKVTSRKATDSSS
jgi:gas vesicle protein